MASVVKSQSLWITMGRIMRRSPPKAREAVWGIIFTLPWILGLLLFTLGPILASMYFSLTDYDIIDPPEWVGVSNYVKAFTDDDKFWGSLGRTFKYAAVVVPFGVMGSLILAMILNIPRGGNTIFRTLFFLPSITPSVAAAILWPWILDPLVGPVNTVLKGIGITGPGWLSDPKMALWTVVIIGLWGSVGGSRMMIFLAGLQGVPESLYEAAQLDGAGHWHKFWHVTVPMISPTLFFNMVLGVIGALQVFAIAFVATGGGPQWATWFYALHLYRQGFQYFRMGYASALAWIFAVLLLVFTYIQITLSRRWVYYEGEEKS